MICLWIFMFDELVVGFNLKEIDDFKVLIVKLCSEYNVMVLLIEYDMKLVMSIFDYIVVINQGVFLVDGMLEQICDNLDVIKVYLGEV